MKKLLIRKFLPVVLMPVMLLFLSCLKNKDDLSGDSKYYIRFKVDGKEKRFIGNATGGPKEQVASGGRYLMSFTAGTSATGVNDERILVSVTKESAVNSPGVYQNNPSSVFFNAEILYIDEKAKSWGSIWMNLDDKLVDTRIEITEMNEEYAKGIFSSTLYDTDDIVLARKITDGEFFVKLY